MRSLWSTVAGRVAMTPVEDARQTLGFRVYPDAYAGLPRSCEARAQPISAALGAGPPERRWVGTIRPLAAATHGQARAAVPGPAAQDA